MVDGQPACIQEALSTCRATGHLHYQTFDGKTFDFAGTCTYTLTKTCDPDPALPLFSVEAKNEDGDNPEVPSVGAVTVRVYDVTVVVVRAENGIVRVRQESKKITKSNATLRCFAGIMSLTTILRAFSNLDASPRVRGRHHTVNSSMETPQRSKKAIFLPDV